MNNTKQMADELRQLADFLESKDFDLEKAYFSNLELYLYAPDAESFLKNLKMIGGFKRDFNEYSATAVKSFGSFVKFILHTYRDVVCEKVKVGVQVIPATAERVIPAQPEKVVDKFEFKCPESLLAGVEDKEEEKYFADVPL